MSIAQKIKTHPRTKAFVLRLIFPKGQARPRRWVRALVNPFIHKRGAGSVIRRYARLDLVPFRNCSIGKATLIEDFSCLNNGMGDLQIGDNCTVGLGDVLIAPIRIGNNVLLAQHIVISGLNHGYADVNMLMRDQTCTTALITIEDDCWVGANSVITAGVTIGKHAVVAAGSVVTKDVPAFSVVGGNPARVLKRYNPASGEWEKP